MEDTPGARRFNLQLVGAFFRSPAPPCPGGRHTVSAFAVNMRTREIGIRTALGASRSNVIGLVLRNCASPILGGLAFGTATAVILAPAVADMLFGVRPRDAISLSIGPAALVCAAPLPTSFPPGARPGLI